MKKLFFVLLLLAGSLQAADKLGTPEIKIINHDARTVLIFQKTGIFVGTVDNSPTKIVSNDGPNGKQEDSIFLVYLLDGDTRVNLGAINSEWEAELFEKR